VKYKIKDILHLEVVPALGCTEPAAVALCAAAAGSLLPEKDLSAIELWVSRNINLVESLLSRQRKIALTTPGWEKGGALRKKTTDGFSPK
jgi:hypothetical protein